MSKRSDKAIELKHDKCNCAQAVALAFNDITDVDDEIIYRITQAFGGELGGMDGHCGALSGAAVIIGLVYDDKKTAMMKIRNISDSFKDRNKTLICRELKGIDTGEALRSCDDCVRDASEFLERELGDICKEI